MDRVVILGRGGAEKSTLAVRLSQVTGLPVIELDQHFWSKDLSPLSQQAWARVQEPLAAANRWIMDGDLGSYDAPAPRLRQADTVVVLDLSLPRCAWRAARRSRERADFSWWLITWRWRSRSHLWPDSDDRTTVAVDDVLRTAADQLRTRREAEG